MQTIYYGCVSFKVLCHKAKPKYMKGVVHLNPSWLSTITQAVKTNRYTITGLVYVYRVTPKVNKYVLVVEIVMDLNKQSWNWYPLSSGQPRWYAFLLLLLLCPPLFKESTRGINLSYHIRFSRMLVSITRTPSQRGRAYY